ncbi:MAG: ATP-grasp domain-containing protein [Balneolaceae bacterium]
MKYMQKQPVLVCSEIGLVRCLGAAGIPVLTGTEESDNSALYSRYSKKRFNFSSYESEEFIQELINIGKELDYKPVLMSYDDRLIINISRHREELLKYYNFLLPEEEMVENLLDKMAFIKLADEYNLPAPASVKVSEEKDLNQIEDQLKKPYLIKPTYRHHWFHKDFPEVVGSYKKAFVCNSFQELEDRYKRISQINPNVVVQEYIEGPDSNMYDVNMYIDAGGEVKGSIVSQKLRVFPSTAGYGSYVITVDDQKILNMSKQIARKLNLRGLINVQFKRDEKTKEPKLIEIHTRTSIFDVLGIKSGINTPALYYADMTGTTVPVNGAGKYGVKYINVSRDLRFIMENHKSLTVLNLAKSYMGTKVFDGLSIKDPMPAVMAFWWMIRHSFGSLLLKQK